MSVTYDDYRIIANKISYLIIKNNKKVKTRKEYSLKGKKASLDSVKKTILKNKNTTNSWGRKFLEAMVIDNTDTSSFPDYVNHNGKKYSKAKYIYMAKYITSWWKKHNKAPTAVPTEKSNPSSKLHDYMTNQGCSGMGQCTGYNCACNSLQQSFYRLTGIKVDESTIAKWAGTTASGTGHPGINTAVAMFNKKYGKNVKLVWYNFSELGKTSNARWEKVKELMKKGALFFHLLYRYNPGIQDGWGHYEVPLSIGNSLKILNSLGSNCGGSTYCGYIETRTRREQETYISGISQKSVAYLYNG